MNSVTAPHHRLLYASKMAERARNDAFPGKSALEILAHELPSPFNRF